MSLVCMSTIILLSNLKTAITTHVLYYPLITFPCLFKFHHKYCRFYFFSVPLYSFSPSAVFLLLIESLFLSEQHSYLYLLSEFSTTYSLWTGIIQFCTLICWRPAFGFAHIYLHCSGPIVRVMICQGRSSTVTAVLRQGPKWRAWSWSQLPHSQTHKGHPDNAPSYQLFS